MKIKAISRKILTVGLFSLLLVLTACVNNDKSSSKEPPSPFPSTVVSEITLGVETKTLDLCETHTLTYWQKGDDALEWTSSDSSVVSVNDGVLTALKITDGMPITITVTAGEASDSCLIYVENSSIPVLRSSLDVIDDVYAVNTTVLDKLSLDAYVLYNGEQYFDATYSYTIEDESVGCFQDDEFVPLKAGSTNVIVTAAWRGVSAPLTANFVVNVVNEYEFKNEGDAITNIELCTIESFVGNHYETEKTLDISVFENGTQLADEKVELVHFANSEKYLSISGRTVKALTGGETSIAIKFIGEDGETRYKQIPVKITRPVADYGKSVKLFSALDGDLGMSFADMFEAYGGYEEGVTQITAWQGNTELTIEGNKILGVDDGDTGIVKNVVITVYSPLISWNVTLEQVYTKIIDEASDLQALKIADENTILDGYYIVVKDIGGVTNRQTIKHLDGAANAYSSSTYGFAGTFDGQGHTISYTSYVNGLFCNLLSGAVVKNVRMENITFDENANEKASIGKVGLAQSISAAATLENVYMQFDDFNAAVSGKRTSAFCTSATSANFKNVIVDLKAPLTKYTIATNLFEALGGHYYGALSVYNVNGTASASNTTTTRYTGVTLITGSLMPMSSAAFNESSANNAYNTVALAYNDLYDEDGNPIEQETLPNSYFMCCNGVRRFDTYREMAASKYFDLSSYTQTGVDAVNKMWTNVFGEYDRTAVEAMTSVLLNGAKGEDFSFRSGTKNVQVMLKVGEKAISEFSLEAVRETNVGAIGINGQTLDCEKPGSTKIRVTFTYNGDEYSKEITVTSTAEMLDVVVWYSTLDNKLYLASDVMQEFTSYEDIQFASFITASGTFEKSNLAKGIENTENIVATYVVTGLDSDGKAISFNVSSYAQILTKASDLDCLKVNSNVIKGYYLVAKDINETKVDTPLHTIATDGTQGFGGVFDGNGHKISFTVNSASNAGTNGLFGYIQANAEIKNVQMVNIAIGSKISLKDNAVLGYKIEKGAKISNVYIQFDSYAKRMGLSVSASDATFTNVVIDVEAPIKNYSLTDSSWVGSVSNYYGILSVYNVNGKASATSQFTSKYSGVVIITGSLMPLGGNAFNTTNIKDQTALAYNDLYAYDSETSETQAIVNVEGAWANYFMCCAGVLRFNAYADMAAYEGTKWSFSWSGATIQKHGTKTFSMSAYTTDNADITAGTMWTTIFENYEEA